MTILSKMPQVLVKMFEGAGCRELFHPYTGHCSVAAVHMSWSGLKGSKYFLLVYVLQLLLKGRDTNREYMKNHVVGFCRSAMFGSVMSGIFLSSCCLLRAILGRFYLYTAVALPGWIAGLSIFLERPVKRSVYSYAFSQASLEYLVRVLESSGIGPLSAGGETLLFMCCNALLLYLLKTANRDEAKYWFFTPPSAADGRKSGATDSPSSAEVCPHEHSCKDYITKSILQYAGAGVGIQLLKEVFTKMKLLVKSPVGTLGTIVWNKDNFKLGAFLGVYIGIYKTVSCLLCRHYGGDQDSYALPAGLLAGVAYYLNPGRAFALSAITTLVHLATRRGVTGGVLPDLPYTAEMIFALSSATLFHAHFLDIENCPRFIVSTVSTVTSGRSVYMYKNYMKIFDAYAHKMSLER